MPLFSLCVMVGLIQYLFNKVVLLIHASVCTYWLHDVLKTKKSVLDLFQDAFLVEFMMIN